MKLATWMKVAAVGILGYVGYRLYKANTTPDRKPLPRPAVKPKPKLPILDRNTAEYKAVKEYLWQSAKAVEAAGNYSAAKLAAGSIISDLHTYTASEPTGKAYVALCELIIHAEEWLVPGREEDAEIIGELLIKQYGTYAKTCFERGRELRGTKVA